MVNRDTKVGLCLSTPWAHYLELEPAIWTNTARPTPLNAIKPLHASNIFSPQLEGQTPLFSVRSELRKCIPVFLIWIKIA